MKKGTILGMTSSNDSIWFKIKPTETTMNALDKVFDLYSQYDVRDKISGIENYESYKSWLHLRIRDFFIENKKTKSFIYLIFTPDILHIIVRKKGNFKTTERKIFDFFEFKKVASNK